MVINVENNIKIMSEKRGEHFCFFHFYQSQQRIEVGFLPRGQQNTKQATAFASNIFARESTYLNDLVEPPKSDNKTVNFPFCER